LRGQTLGLSPSANPVGLWEEYHERQKKHFISFHSLHAEFFLKGTVMDLFFFVMVAGLSGITFLLIALLDRL
jgi:hypothetical protein